MTTTEKKRKTRPTFLCVRIYSIFVADISINMACRCGFSQCAYRVVKSREYVAERESDRILND